MRKISVLLTKIKLHHASAKLVLHIEKFYKWPKAYLPTLERENYGDFINDIFWLGMKLP